MKRIYQWIEDLFWSITRNDVAANLFLGLMIAILLTCIVLIFKAVTIPYC